MKQGVTSTREYGRRTEILHNGLEGAVFPDGSLWAYSVEGTLIGVRARRMDAESACLKFMYEFPAAAQECPQTPF